MAETCGARTRVKAVAVSATPLTALAVTTSPRSEVKKAAVREHGGASD
jgi:hypothetical protein